MSAVKPYRLLIWGAGGHAKVVSDAARAAMPDCALCFVDDDPARRTDCFCGAPVMPFTPQALAGSEFVIAIGDNRLRADRYRTAGTFGRAGIVIHPSAVVSRSARIDPGTVVLASAVVNAGAWIGANSIVNTGAIVEHDCIVGEHSHIAPGAILGGGARTGSLVQVGLGARVLPRVRIGDRAVVGAGGVVIRDVAEGLVVAGVPCRVLRGARAAGCLPAAPAELVL